MALVGIVKLREISMTLSARAEAALAGGHSLRVSACSSLPAVDHISLIPPPNSKLSAMATETEDKRLIVVANRLPVTISKDDKGEYKFKVRFLLPFAQHTFCPLPPFGC
jgi:hypothetical protein